MFAFKVHLTIKANTLTKILLIGRATKLLTVKLLIGRATKLLIAAELLIGRTTKLLTAAELLPVEATRGAVIKRLISKGLLVVKRAEGPGKTLLGDALTAELLLVAKGVLTTVRTRRREGH